MGCEKIASTCKKWKPQTYFCLSQMTQDEITNPCSHLYQLNEFRNYIHFLSSWSSKGTWKEMQPVLHLGYAFHASSSINIEFKGANAASHEGSLLQPKPKKNPTNFFAENQIPTLNVQSETSNPAPQKTEKTFSLIWWNCTYCWYLCKW